MKLRDKLKQGQPVIGTFSKTSDPAIVEIMGHAGFDYVIIDLEHGPVTSETAQNLVRAADVVGISPIIRVPMNEESYILKALDIGAHGVQVPQINTKEQAERLVRSARYHPEGQRGVCRYVRAAKYSALEPHSYFKASNERTLTIGHLEGLEGLQNIDEILEVSGLDVFFIGPYDLSQSLGIPGDVTNPILLKKI